MATANPCTIKALEAATLRRCEVKEIGKRITLIDQIRELIPFAKDADLRLSEQEAIIQSKFFVDNSQYGNVEEIEKKLGILEPGDEWLCFTFFDQKLDKELCKKYIDIFCLCRKITVFYIRQRVNTQQKQYPEVSVTLGYFHIMKPPIKSTHSSIKIPYYPI